MRRDDDSHQPLWREELSVFAADERYVGRRQFAKFLVLTSVGMFAGNLWLLAKGLFSRAPSRLPAVPVARLGELPVGGVKMFAYPGPDDHCLLVRYAADRWAAYSQKCTHLSCAVYYAGDSRRLVCPCHHGFFAVEDGRVLQGPPPRPLPRILLQRRGDLLVAVGVDLQGGEEARA
jgi:nitrite reductase/ring-hydroxylating ferredoxin subunit